MTASAAEEFVGHVAGFKLGEVIGDNTAGAGFRNQFFPVEDGYVISVSVGRAVLASTARTGKASVSRPTTKVDADNALDVAQVHALRQIAPPRPADEKREAGSPGRVARRARSIRPRPRFRCRRYAGSYDGVRSVTIDGGTLIFQREGGPKVAMIALGGNEFGINEDPMDPDQFQHVTGNAAHRAQARSRRRIARSDAPRAPMI